MTRTLAVAGVLGLVLLALVVLAHHPPAAVTGIQAALAQVAQARQVLHCVARASSPLACSPP
jgi:hypothetical protein